MNHQELYLQTCLEGSKILTQRYSTSFSLGIKTLDKKFHPAIYAIYGFVRVADEIVDTFHEADKARHLKEFSAQTYQAIEEGLSFNPILHAFQWAVNTYHIEKELIEAFLFSMEMDLDLHACTPESYKTYIYGSAEVVGLMCLRVFCEGNHQQYSDLKEEGRKLGAAFQKVNFLRDMKSDFQERGRIYFPGADFSAFTPAMKQEIELDIEQDFQAAYQGILKLPKGAKLGVYLAYIYYLRLFEKIRKMPPQKILKERIRVPDTEKMSLLLLTYLRGAVNAL